MDSSVNYLCRSLGQFDFPYTYYATYRVLETQAGLITEWVGPLG